MALTSQQLRSLDEEGYVLLENAVPLDRIAELKQRILQLFDEEGDNAGGEFMQEAGSLRLANLVDKGEIFQWAIAVPAVLEAVGHILVPEFKLSSLNARSALPHNERSQPLHVDMSAIPDDNGYWVANVIWMLDEFTLQNGATRLVPGSHNSGQRPQDALDDPAATHPNEVLITGKVGTLAVMNSHLWHGGTPNRTDSPRLALHAFYCRRDKPQQQYQKRMLCPETQAGLSPQLCKLLALDDPLNDELSAGNVTRSGFLKK